jgi:hypothetical protein
VRALVAACGGRLRAGLPRIHGIDYQMHRGLPIALAAGPAAAAAFLRAGPPSLVTGLRLRNLRGVRDLAARPELRVLRRLDLTGCRVTRGHAPQALTESPNLSGLVRLGLRDADAHAGVAAGVSRNPALGGLRALDLAGNRRLALPHLPGRLLAARPVLADLDLSRTEPAVGVLWDWVTDPAFGQVDCLRLNRNRLGDSGALSVAMSPRLAGLRRLELRDNGITGLGAMALAESQHLEKLGVLDLQRNPIPPAAGDRLRARFGSAVRLSR